MARRRMVQAFQTAKTLANYADVAVMPVDVDPQIILSRNTVRQPFYLAFEEDTVIAQMSGTGAVRLRESNVLSWSLMQGDHVYIPAGTPHRIEPAEEGVLIRYVGNDPAYRAAIFACENCGEELDRLEWRQDLEVDSIALYSEICRRFNEDLAARTCDRCGEVADVVSFDRLGWTTEAVAAL